MTKCFLPSRLSILLVRDQRKPKRTINTALGNIRCLFFGYRICGFAAGCFTTGDKYSFILQCNDGTISSVDRRGLALNISGNDEGKIRFIWLGAK